MGRHPTSPIRYRVDDRRLLLPNSRGYYTTAVLFPTGIAQTHASRDVIVIVLKRPDDVLDKPALYGCSLDGEVLWERTPSDFPRCDTARLLVSRLGDGWFLSYGRVRVALDLATGAPVGPPFAI